MEMEEAGKEREEEEEEEEEDRERETAWHRSTCSLSMYSQCKMAKGISRLPSQNSRIPHELNQVSSQWSGIKAK